MRRAGLFEANARGDALFEFEVPDLPPGVEGVELDFAEVAGPIKVLSARPQGAGQFLVELEASAHLAVTFYAPKPDAFAWTETQARLITHSDWNKHMVAGALTTEVAASFDARWRAPGGAVDDYETSIASDSVIEDVEVVGVW